MNVTLAKSPGGAHAGIAGIGGMMTDYREGLDCWLGQQRPCERMMVYDRNGVLLGRIKKVLVDEMIVAPPFFAFGERAERRLRSGNCRVHGGAVHTSFSREQLAAI